MVVEAGDSSDSSDSSSDNDNLYMQFDSSDSDDAQMSHTTSNSKPQKQTPLIKELNSEVFKPKSAAEVKQENLKRRQRIGEMLD